jgi:hypothetical protein
MNFDDWPASVGMCDGGSMTRTTGNLLGNNETGEANSNRRLTTMKTQNSFATTSCPNALGGRLRTASAARLLPLVLLLTLPAVVQAQDYTYTTNDDNTITITGYTGSGGDVTIPDTINGLPVTGIGNNSFFDCTGLTSVTIGNSVTSIGSEAFCFCEGMTNVTIGNSVTNIGIQAFFCCYSLASVTIPSSVTSIGENAFESCTSLTAITVAAQNLFYSSVNGVLFDYSQKNLVICPHGFSGSLLIPGSVTNIVGLESDYYPNLTAITVAAQNLFYSSVNGVLFDYSQKNLVICPAGFSGSFTIPGSVTNISEGAFYSCTSLTSVTIPNSVTSIGEEAFFYCCSLTSITIPNSVTSIGEWAFLGCYNLTSVTIPSSVTSIGENAFESCTSLTSVYFQGNASSANWDVFENDNHATVYYLPGTTGWENFAQLTGLPTVLWNAQAQISDGSFGVRTNCFGFTITGTSNLVVVVEACSLADPTWIPLQTNTLTGGSCYFSDCQWTNYPVRCYRLRSP